LCLTRRLRGLLPSPATAPAVAQPAISSPGTPSTCRFSGPSIPFVGSPSTGTGIALAIGRRQRLAQFKQSKHLSDGLVPRLTSAQQLSQLIQRLHPRRHETHLGCLGPDVLSSVTWSGDRIHVPDLLRGARAELIEPSSAAHQRTRCAQTLVGCAVYKPVALSDRSSPLVVWRHLSWVTSSRTVLFPDRATYIRKFVLSLTPTNSRGTNSPFPPLLLLAVFYGKGFGPPCPALTVVAVFLLLAARSKGFSLFVYAPQFSLPGPCGALLGP